MSSKSHAPPILPLTNSPLASRKFRSTTRRISYTLKNRAGKYAVPLSVGSIIALVFLALTWSRGPAHHYPSHLVKLYTREQIEQATFGAPSRLTDPYDNVHAPRPGRLPNKGSGDANGVSNLLESEEELIAEDDLFWMNYKEPTPLTEKEKEANKEMEAHRQDVIQQNAVHSLKALIWWMAEGGIIPTGWEVPTKSYFDKFGGRGMERLLNGIDQGKQDRKGRGDWKPIDDKDEEKIAFTEGWGDLAKEELRLVVFSKSYCPYSKRGKAILSKYSLDPSPYIIELDKRADTGAIQNLLFHLTGRRTVPNIILDFKSLGGADELTLLDAEGGLQRTFHDAGLIKPARNAYLPDYFAEEDDKPYIHVPEDLRDDDDADDVEVDEVTRDEEHPAEVDVERRRPQAQAKAQAPAPGKDARAGHKAPGAVAIEAAVRQAHEHVDRQEGYGAFQQQGWRDVPDAVLYAEPEVLPRRGGEDVEVPQARNEDASDLKGRSGGKRVRKPFAKPNTPKRADSPPEVQQAVARDNVQARQPVQLGARDGDADQHGVERALIDRGQAQEPIAVEDTPVKDDEPSEAPAPDPWGNTDPLRLSEPQAQAPPAEEADTSTLDTAHPYPPMEFSWPEADEPSELPIKEGDDAGPGDLALGQDRSLHQEDESVPLAAGHAIEGDAPLARADVESNERDVDQRAIPQDKEDRAIRPPQPEQEQARMVQPPSVDLNEARAPLEPIRAPQAAARNIKDNAKDKKDRSTPDDRRSAELEDDAALEFEYYDPEPRDVVPPRRYAPGQLAKQYEAPRGQQKEAAVDRARRKEDSDTDRYVQAPDPRQLEEDGIAALSAAANLRRRPNGKKLRGAVDTAEVL